METQTATRASTCLCADEAKSYHWNITAVKLGKSRTWQVGKERTEVKNTTLSSATFALFSPSSMYICLYFSPSEV